MIKSGQWNSSAYQAAAMKHQPDVLSYLLSRISGTYEVICQNRAGHHVTISYTQRKEVDVTSQLSRKRIKSARREGARLFEIRCNESDTRGVGNKLAKSRAGELMSCAVHT